MQQAHPSFENVGVFLSHAHDDRLFAQRLGNDLICREFVWIDKAEISIGDSLLGKIAYRDCEIPPLLVGKLYADFRDESEWTIPVARVDLNDDL
jgi:hypothetical protein